jgi:hypothetical protein
MNWTAGLNARQATAVTILVWFTLIGAVALAFVFRRWNMR